jgi:hypothetical protein
MLSIVPRGRRSISAFTSSDVKGMPDGIGDVIAE